MILKKKKKKRDTSIERSGFFGEQGFMGKCLPFKPRDTRRLILFVCLSIFLSVSVSSFSLHPVIFLPSSFFYLNIPFSVSFYFSPSYCLSLLSFETSPLLILLTLSFFSLPPSFIISLPRSFYHLLLPFLFLFFSPLFFFLLTFSYLFLFSLVGCLSILVSIWLHLNLYLLSLPLSLTVCPSLHFPCLFPLHSVLTLPVPVASLTLCIYLSFFLSSLHLSLCCFSLYLSLFFLSSPTFLSVPPLSACLSFSFHLLHCQRHWMIYKLWNKKAWPWFLITHIHTHNEQKMHWEITPSERRHNYTHD